VTSFRALPRVNLVLASQIWQHRFNQQVHVRREVTSNEALIMQNVQQKTHGKFSFERLPKNLEAAR
jgi:hypothetical protein